MADYSLRFTDEEWLRSSRMGSLYRHSYCLWSSQPYHSILWHVDLPKEEVRFNILWHVDLSKEEASFKLQDYITQFFHHPKFFVEMHNFTF